MRKDTLTVTSTKPNPDGLPLPAITVCPVGPGEVGYGWKIENLCNIKKTVEEMEVCVRQNGFGLNSTIKQTSIFSNMSLMKGNDLDSTLWSFSLPMLTMGVCYTLNYNQTLSITDRLIIKFVKIESLGPIGHKVFIHDSTFFLQKVDNFFIPFISLNDPFGYNYRIVSTHSTRMKIPSKFDCNVNKKYNFNSCIRRSLANKIGCSYPWESDHATGKSYVCNTTKQIIEYEDMKTLLYWADKEKLHKHTGCQIPCSYNHYSIVGKPMVFKTKAFTYMSLSFASTDISKSQEVLLYPVESMVSEFGGALGLFLGFSFLGMIDLAKSYCHSLFMWFLQFRFDSTT